MNINEIVKCQMFINSHGCGDQVETVEMETGTIIGNTTILHYKVLATRPSTGITSSLYSLAELEAWAA